MNKENLPDIVIKNFEYYYNLLLDGDKGELLESGLEPINNLAEYSTLDSNLEDIGISLKQKIVVIKLNGGLGTSMGLSEAKSLLKVKNDLTFLDIIARQAELSNIRLVLMNSFNTREKSLELLSNYSSLSANLPLDFLQHKIPKINSDTFLPVEHDMDKDLEWCPPGHGEIYTALLTSGMLDKLIGNGVEYAFISNSDNLGAVLDFKILGFMINNKIPFLMEVAERTESDKKGGHLAKLKNSQLVLRESAQCPVSDLKDFQDISKHKYFNTNNIWLNLKSLKNILQENDNIFGLPMIVNKKTVDPKDPSSQPVIQLETAMGAAISVFDGADALLVPRSRFAPVKTTEDLLAIRSDNYILTNDYRVIINPERKLKPLTISLDPKFYKLVDDLEKRIPKAPSLLKCKKLTIKGDYAIGENVVFEDDVELVNNSTEQKLFV